MLRVRLFAFAVACLMVAPQADAQGNRGRSNGVPGQISSIETIVNEVLAQISSLPDFAELEAELAALQASLAGAIESINSLKAGASEMSGDIAQLQLDLAALSGRIDAEVATLNGKIDAAEGRLDAKIDTVQGELDARIGGLEGQMGTFEDTLSDVTGDVSSLTSRVAALEAAGGGGGAGGRIMWSGGCPSNVSSTGVVVYCSSGLDFSTASGYLTTSGDGVFSVETSGLYRINFRGRMSGARGIAQLQVVAPGGSTTFASNAVNQASGTQTRDVNLDVIVRLNAGDFFLITADAGTQPIFAWAIHDAGSRLQIEYVGPLP